MTRATRASGVFATDRALVVTSWDPWLADATGVREADALGHPLEELFPELVERGLADRLRRVAESGTVEVLAPVFHAYLLPCPPREGSAHFTRMQQHVTIAPLRAGAEIVGLTITIEDVTRRRDRERELAAQLRSADDAGRLQAARLLGAEPGARLELMDALGDHSWRVRRAAIEGLARGTDDATVQALVAAVRERHRDPAVLNAAIAAIARAEHDVVPSLVELLDAPDTESDVRIYAALTLGLLGDRRAAPSLLRALDDPEANVRYHAVEALGRIGARETATRLAALAESRDFSIAFAALDALALIGEPSVAPRILPLLDDPLLQVAAAEALGRLGSEDAVGPLAALLDRPRTPVGAVAGALAMLHDRMEAQHGEGRLVISLARAMMTPRTAPALIEALERTNDDERHGLVVVLGWVDDDAGADALARTLVHPRVRRLAAEELAQRGDAAVEPLLTALHAEDHEVRKAAASALGSIGAARAVPALLALLEDQPEVVVVAAGALAKMGDPRALEPLVDLLDHPQAAVRQAAVAALSSIGHEATRQRVRPLLASPEARAREGAVRIIGYLGDADALDSLLALGRDRDESVRRAAIEQLAYVDESRATAAIAEALTAGSAGVRAAAARALAHVETKDAVPALLLASRDADPWVRYYAARSMGHHRRADLVPTLVALATRDDVTPVRIAAVEALAMIGDASGIDAIAAMATDDDPMAARAALLALGRSRSAESLRVLIAALDHGEREPLLAAIASLGRRGDPEAVPALAHLAHTHGDPDVCAAALQALASTEGGVTEIVATADDPRRAPMAVATLAALEPARIADVGRGLRHPSVDVRCAVIEALGRMRHPSAAPLLVGALDDESPAVRLAATQALARVDLRAAEARLGDIARSDADPAVRRAAARALGR